MRFDLYEENDPEDAPPALSWENGQVTGRPDALAAFHDRVTLGEPVGWVQPSPDLTPGAETWQQFLATAYALPITWDDVSGDEKAFAAMDEALSVPEGAVA